jgi:hypothetical protein
MSLRELAPLFSKGQAPPSTPRLLEVRAVDVHTACGLNKEWHSRMPYIHWSNIVRNKDYICYVAEYDHTAYAAAIWSSPVAANRLTDGEQSLELRRLAISEDAPKFTATRMLSKMVKDLKARKPHIKRVISYQDTAVHSGTIYKAAGWSIGAENEGMSWSNETRKRNEEQSLAKKIRWELSL